jgi:hypothetical protein
MICDQQKSSQTVAPAAVVPQTGPPVAPLRKRTWDSCAGLPESEVPLAQLDSSIHFDDDYCEPIRYERGLLRYRGTMSHASFVHLQALSRDRQYQRALEQLFVASATPPSAVGGSAKLLAGVGLSAAAVVMMAGAWFFMGGRTAPQAPIVKNVAATAAAIAPGQSGSTKPDSSADQANQSSAKAQVER